MELVQMIKEIKVMEEFEERGDFLEDSRRKMEKIQ